MEETPLHFDKDFQSDSSAFDWLPSQNGLRARSQREASADTVSSASSVEEIVQASNYPHGTKSLAGISARAFALGIAFGVGISSTSLLWSWNSFWRIPFFLSSLSLFHFLEYYLTARYNTPFASLNAFLLSRNGRAYNAAHGGAFLECATAAFYFPAWQHFVSNIHTIPLGLALMVVGQATRSKAMADAGTNFNHTVQQQRNEGHNLVTTGIYSWIRHPSYFGFFWWALGTQIVLGNLFSLTTYAVTLWLFFRHRIRQEEALLYEFFGKGYEDYRARTRVWIPFIR